MTDHQVNHKFDATSLVSLAQDPESIGDVVIADDVVAVIAGISAVNVNGVTGMSGGLAEDIARRVSGRSPSKGVVVEVSDKAVRIDLRVFVEYGVKINEVCRKLQEEVKQSVESMTGLYVTEINVKVDGVELASASE